MFKSRENTVKLLDLAEQGVIDWESLARDLLGWLSDYEVGEFVRANDYFNDDEEGENDD